MPKTPRFITYTDKNNIYIVHLYLPRFVGKVVVESGLTRVYVHDDWGCDDDDLLKKICIKMKDWYYYSNR